ncbi:MAG: methyltransferase domain-containing protein, partial [Bdellovibrionales bacterium]|nr:methyltransferase domain-containing protein [Bdellovibrionales bacterium]
MLGSIFQLFGMSTDFYLCYSDKMTQIGSKPFANLSLPETLPQHMAAYAKLVGFIPANPMSCKVVELGCSRGGNLLPIAAFNPNCQCIGVDTVDAEVAEANAHVKAAELNNVSFRSTDLKSFKEDNIDYLICHGVYSWVDEETRRSICRIARECLSPQGLVYLSFDTNPGWHLKGLVRDILQFGKGLYPKIDPSGSSPLGGAKKVIGWLEQGFKAKSESPYTLSMLREFQILASIDAPTIEKEYLEGNHNAFYLSDFIRTTTEAGLSFLGDMRSFIRNFRILPPEV